MQLIWSRIDPLQKKMVSYVNMNGNRGCCSCLTSRFMHRVEVLFCSRFRVVGSTQAFLFHFIRERQRQQGHGSVHDLVCVWCSCPAFPFILSCSSVEVMCRAFWDLDINAFCFVTFLASHHHRQQGTASHAFCACCGPASLFWVVCR